MPVIGRRDIPITRGEVFDWFEDVSEEDYRLVVQAKLAEKDLTDTQVDMGEPLGIISLEEVIMQEFA